MVEAKVRMVLLVDDDKDDNFVHKRLLKKTGFCEEISVCENGLEALDFLRNEGAFQDERWAFPKPDLIFLDIKMPEMDGWEFLNQYRQLPEKMKGGPVIAMLTSSLDPRDMEKAQKLGLVSEFMNKPLRKENLETIFKKYFN